MIARLRGLSTMRAVSALALIAVISTSIAAGADWPDCEFQANDNGEVVITDLWLGDVNGNPHITCTEGSPTPAYIWANFTSMSPKKGVMLLANLELNGELIYSSYPSGICVASELLPGTNPSSRLFPISWTCSPVPPVLTEIIISWEEGTCSGDCCITEDRNVPCGDRGVNSNKGGTDGSMVVKIPPVCSFTGPSILCSSGEDAIYSTAAVQQDCPCSYSYDWSWDNMPMQYVSSGDETSAIVSQITAGFHTVYLDVSKTYSNYFTTTSTCHKSIQVRQRPTARINIL